MDADEFKTILFERIDFDGQWPEEDLSWSFLDGKLRLNGVTDIWIEDKNEHVEGSFRTDLYVVFGIDGPEGTEYFRKTGVYHSWEGAFWDGPLTKVSLTTKSVTVWDDADEYDSFEEDSYY